MADKITAMAPAIAVASLNWGKYVLMLNPKFFHILKCILDIECKKDSPQLDNWKAESVDARRLGIQVAARGAQV